MKLYAIVNKNGTPIAYHENKRVIKDFYKDMNKLEFSIVKVKHPKKIVNTSSYAELYLVKLSGSYIQSKFYDSAYILREEELYDYDTVVNILVRELEYNSSNMSKEEKNAVKKTLGFFEERVAEIKENKIDFESVKHFDEMRQEYQRGCYYE